MLVSEVRAFMAHWLRSAYVLTSDPHKAGLCDHAQQQDFTARVHPPSNALEEEQCIPSA